MSVIDGYRKLYFQLLKICEELIFFFILHYFSDEMVNQFMAKNYFFTEIHYSHWYKNAKISVNLPMN